MSIKPNHSDLTTAKDSLRQSCRDDHRILNCVPSLDREDDWTIDTAIEEGIVEGHAPLPSSVDLREDWWAVRNQQSTGACVGFATADGVLRWHYVKAGLIDPEEPTSPRFIWMANKETDEITEYPTSFIDSAGTQTKRALRIAHRYGCVLEKHLPMDGALWRDSTVSLYSKASSLRIESYFNLGTDLNAWRRWLSTGGPILTRLSVDSAFMNAEHGSTSYLDQYDSSNTHGGHAVAIVGYTEGAFIIRNSWGTDWGDQGFAYASVDYVKAAFTEAYGVVVPQNRVRRPNDPHSPIPDGQPEPLTEPRFEGITLEIEEGLADPLEQAERALHHVLGPNSEWRVEPVLPTEPLDFDLLPPAGREHEVEVSRGWELCHELTALSQVAFAEPSFIIFQDNDPGVSIPGRVEAQDPTEADGFSGAELIAAGLPVVDPDWRDWSPLFIRSREAWDLPPRPPQGGFSAGKARGEGVRIGHPDSGYRSHKELWDPIVEPRMRLLKHLDHDFVDNDLEPMTNDGDHGLATASVVMSWEPSSSAPSPNHAITGVAPRAEIVPMRVAKVRPIVPTPMLLRSGMIRLRRAIDYGSTVAECDVFSISLGWLPNRSLHKAIRRAVRDHHAIVCAAAGNQVRYIVVWPAHYRETIAVAACNFNGSKWGPSSRGKRVDVTAPGKDVWKADHSLVVKRSSGTSYSAASTAGIAALWLAHWGKDFLRDKYTDLPLNEVFRYVLKRSCVKPPGWNIRKWGSGIVNAKATLEYSLPSRAQVLRAMRSPRKANQSAQSKPFSALLASFEQIPETTLLGRIHSLLGTSDAGDAERPVNFEAEITFHILTNPRLREALSSPTTDEGIETNDLRLDTTVLSPSLRKAIT